MNQTNDCNNNVQVPGRSGFLIVVVLYILLAIILGSRSNNMFYY